MGIKKIGLVTAGGDCPGLNAAIRAVVKTAMSTYNAQVIGFLDGLRGVVINSFVDMGNDRVSNIIARGGTILGSSNRDNPFAFYYDDNQKDPLDVSDVAVRHYELNHLDALVCIGGDGTLTMASQLAKKGLNIVGIPKTIDNDVQGTDQTIGFDSAVVTATEAIDKIRTTAESHHRGMVIELMGRTAGWPALFAGIASGSDVILLPEIPFDMAKICEHVLDRRKSGKRFTIICVAEGARPKNQEVITIADRDKRTGMVRLGGIGNYIAKELEEKTGVVSRTTVLGHLQRGGSPTPYDRILATRSGVRAMQLVMEGVFGVTVCLKGSSIEHFSLEKVANNPRIVPLDSEYLTIAKSIGSFLGD
ncbi:MAG: 6-phosphofructokinase [Oligoflexia bacterium]|nr:6-phosphofructokinase [Oligoflexia bacterium]MBF0363935.1 6-phosphofructokinase [Oligoflexia bacterium]